MAWVLLATNAMQVQRTAASNTIHVLFIKASPGDGHNSGPDKPATADIF